MQRQIVDEYSGPYAIPSLGFSIPDFDYTWPLVCDNEKIRLAFMEIAVKGPSRKSHQAQRKKRLVLKHFRDNYQQPYELNWMPQTYRIVAHHDPGSSFGQYSNGNTPEVILQYLFIDYDRLANVARDHSQLLTGIVENCKYPAMMLPLRDHLDSILTDTDSSKLHHFLWKSPVQRVRFDDESREMTDRHDNYARGLASTVRGVMAELFVIEDLRQSRPLCMDMLFCNYINCTSKRYPYGTEVDGIFVYHGHQVMKELLSNLRDMKHIRVHSIWNNGNGLNIR